jgi:hypothetical protein
VALVGQRHPTGSLGVNQYNAVRPERRIIVRRRFDPLLDQVKGAGISINEGRVDHSLKFSKAAGSAGVRKLPARNNSVSREHKTFDGLNFLCA